ncbi:OmpA family protein [Halomonas sp. McH1-25]|uniref:OmpA/MotB family protein n=1 Tax=unclassified Halomonas TaxID=2609666 RepID=UPI001EF4B1E5|nr:MULTISPECIES: OmpA family protein [unclassified Halomonas]MCG7601967.1 OmpA family protein [Halomonas sp. McH1-25]MCP1341592.1 OmpA family protein [Halomonas sp. FL8]MCP1360238.1 OmpA family protein [Halomonas sp. BBD45]MCP1366614.1 OmpA family protein [Halomonas sp. BBD48]
MSDLDRQQADLLGGDVGGGEDGESWLMSYLDVLTLLITLFVLLLALAGQGSPGATEPAADGDLATPTTPATSQAPAMNGVQPRHDGVLPQFDGITVSRSAQGLNLRIQDHLLFDSAQATLTEPGRQVLQGIIPLLQRSSGDISVEGHSDSLPIDTPRYPSNWELSSARASAVLRFLVQQGIASPRLRAIGYADTRPLAANDDSAGRATNRRVELVLHEVQ